MGLLTSLFQRFSLTTNQRETIWKAFGSFNANQFATNSANSILDNSYESNTDVYAVIHRIIEVIKSNDWVVEEKKGDNWIKLEGTTLNDLIENPNKTKGYTWNDIEEMLLVYMLTTGNGYLYGETAITRSLIQELDVLPNQYVSVRNIGNDFFLPQYKYCFSLGTYREFDKSQVCQFTYFNPSYNSLEERLYGLSPIVVAARAVQGGNDAWGALNSLYQNRGASGLITDKSQRPMLPEEAKKVQQDFDSQIAGVNNFGKIKVTNKDLSYIQMGMTAEELKLVESGVISLRAICNVFNVSSSLFNDPANKTYNNMKEAEKSFYTDCIIPLSNKMAEKFNSFLVKNHFPNRNVRMRQDFTTVEVLQSDKKQEAEKDKIVMDGINVILNMPVSAEVKAKLIQENYDVSEETVATYLSTTQSSNKQLNIMSSVSPLLATQLLQQLNSSEIRSILELTGNKEIIKINANGNETI